MPALELSTGLAIYYREYNPSSAFPVVLLHGLGATGESWGFQIPILVQAGYRVIAPDVRGYGKSTHPGGPIQIASFAVDIAGLLQRLRVERAALVGISMGGVIALQLAVDYAQLIDKLVLVNTFSQFRILDLSTALYYTWRFILSHFVSLSAQAQSVTHRLFPRPDQVGLRQILYEQILQAQPDTYLKTMRALVRFNLTDQLKEIRLPTLIVTGEKDSTVHPRLQKLLADRIPAARQVTIAGAGHAVIAEEPDQFNRILLEFLGRPVEYVSPEVTNGSQPLPSASQFDRK